MPAWEIRRFPSIDSTNAYLVGEASAGAAEGLVAVAGTQESGHGRRDRTWLALPGTSLLVSVLLRPDIPASRVPLVTLIASLAARDACLSVCDAPVSLKWPNDIIVGEAKVGGVLVEVEWAGGAGGPASCVVGLGLNVSWPEGMGGKSELAGATSLNLATGEDLVPSDLLEPYLGAFERRYGTSGDALDPVAVLEEYRAHLSTIGRSVLIVTDDEEFGGRALDVDPQGHLLVDVGACIRTVVAADVVHVSPLSGAP